jgi:hypothetical protein
MTERNTKRNIATEYALSSDNGSVGKMYGVFYRIQTEIRRFRSVTLPDQYTR